MKKNLIVKLVVFNFILATINIICFSKGFLGFSIISSNISISIFSIIIIITSFLLFVTMNYKLLNSDMAKHDYNLETLNNYNEYIVVLNTYSYKHKFKEKIDEAIDQIERIERKQKSLDNMLFQKFQKNSKNKEGYKEVLANTSKLFVNNTKRIINLLEIFDQQEYDDLIKRLGKLPETKQQLLEENDDYINKLLAQNEEILLNFDKLLVEISKIGDSEEADEINLQRISDIVSNMKDLRLNTYDEALENKYKQ